MKLYNLDPSVLYLCGKNRQYIILGFIVLSDTSV